MKYEAGKWMRGVLTAVLVCAALTAWAYASAEGLGAFAADTQTYRAGLFSDVAEGAWYESAVRTVVQKGIMGGAGGVFLPDRPMTWAEAVTITARLHAAYQGAEIPEAEGRYWYQRYWDYDAAQKLLPVSAPGVWQAGTENISREDLCLLMRGVLSDADLPTINDSAIPDLNEARNSARSAVQDLYAAGIFAGKDGGNFRPAASATRAEIATVVTRLICPAQRVGSDSRVNRAMAGQYGNFLVSGDTVRLGGRNYYLVQTAEYESVSERTAVVSEIVSRTDTGAVSTVYRTENGLSKLSAGDDGRLYFIETVEAEKSLFDELRRIDATGGTLETLYTAGGIGSYTLYDGEVYIFERVNDEADWEKWNYRIGRLTGHSLRHLTPTMSFEQALYAGSSLYCFGGKLYYLYGDSSYSANGATYYSYSLYAVDLENEVRSKLIDGAGHGDLYLSEVAYDGATAWFLGTLKDESTRVVKRANLRLPELIETVARVPREANHNYVKLFANGSSVYYNASSTKRLWQISPAGAFTERMNLGVWPAEERPAVTPQGILARNSGAVVLPDGREMSYYEFLGKPHLVKGETELAAASEEKIYIEPEQPVGNWTGGLLRDFRTADGGYVAEIVLLNGTSQAVKLDAIAFELTIGNTTLRPRLAVSPLAAGATQVYTLVVPAQALGATAFIAAEASLDWWYYVLN